MAEEETPENQDKTGDAGTQEKKPAAKKEKPAKQAQKSSSIKSAGRYLIKNYRVSLAIAFGILAVFGSVLLYTYFSTGHVAALGLQFTGGVQAVIPLETIAGVNAERIESDFSQRFAAEARATLETGLAGANPRLILESARPITQEDLQSFLAAAGLKFRAPEFNTFGPVVGATFLSQAQYAILAAFVAMGFVVLFIYRRFIVAIAVILAAVSDMIVALVGMNIFGIKLTLASLAGLLMLIGYSVDTDILLSSRVLKRQVEDIDRTIAASAKTGLMMTATALLAISALYIFSRAAEIQQIALVLMMGLLADIVFTWLQNVGIIKWWFARRAARKEREG